MRELVNALLTRRPPPAETGVAVVALLVLAVADGWRVALLTALAATAVAATRIRWAATAATALTVVVALLALSGRGIGSDERPVAASRDAGAVERTTDGRR